jgi:capsid protein
MPDKLYDGKKPHDRLTTWDKVVSFFNPVQGIVRLRAREMEHQFSYGYNDDNWQRSSSGGLFAHASAETWRSNRDRLKAMWDARDLVQFEFVGGMIARIVLYTCGKLTSNSETGDSQVDEAYNTYWKGWCGDEPSEDGTTRCDITGRHRLLKLAQMGLAGFIVDGDFGYLEVSPEFSPTKEYCLQAIEADRIGSPLEQLVQEDYVGGVGLDVDTGRVQFYRLFKRSRTNQYTKIGEIAPQDFIHIHDPDRPDEYRGRTKLLRCLNLARDIREWSAAEMQAGKTQSQWAALIGIKDPFNHTAKEWTDKTPEGTPTQKAQWGQLLRMAEGEVFSMLAPPSRPTGAFMEFVQFSLRKLAVSLDLPFGFLWDLATLGGVTARIEVQQAQRKIEYWQEQILINKFLNRVRQKVIAQGIANEQLPPHPLWRKCSWHFGLSIQTDVGYEAEADIGMATTGIVPMAEIIAKYGHTPREVWRSNVSTINSAIEEGAAGGLPVETIARGLMPDVTAQKAAMVTGPVAPPEPGTIEAVGDKGVKQIIDLIKGVGEGKIDRDAAINTLEHSYGVERSIAEGMIPEEPSKAKLQMLNPKPAPAGAKVTTTKKKSTSKKK